MDQSIRGGESYHFEGIGDDCAIIPVEDGFVLALTTDLVVEGVHFLHEATTPEMVAQKALHVNLSDVAAMGLRPIATLLSIALPAKVAQSDWPDRFVAAWSRASEEANVTLIGGDTTKSTDKIVINVTAIGRGKKEHVKRRSAAKEGDVICVARPLGRSKAGLNDILNGIYESEAAHWHNAPTAQIRQGVWLGAHEEVHAMMDISDGLGGDIFRILSGSEVSAEIALEKIPIAQDATLEDAVSGGEEYALLLTVSPEGFDPLSSAFLQEFGTPLYAIGRITAIEDTPRVTWLKAGKEFPLAYEIFSHFS